MRGVKLDAVTYYVWPWLPHAARDIKPVANTFEYIEGAFRPEVQRLISLLAGTRLYGNPLAAVRELIQNAFDAISEQVAHELLTENLTNLAPARSSRLALHRVGLTVDREGADWWLVCSDTGVGMTRRIIERHLLVSGSNPQKCLSLAGNVLPADMTLSEPGGLALGSSVIS